VREKFRVKRQKIENAIKIAIVLQFVFYFIFVPIGCAMPEGDEVRTIIYGSVFSGLYLATFLVFIYLSIKEYKFLNSKFKDSANNPSTQVAIITSIYCLSFVPRIATNMLAAFFPSVL
jgi:hypothetical protein